MARIINKEILDFYENLIHIGSLDFECAADILNEAGVVNVGLVLAKKYNEMMENYGIFELDICSLAFEIVLDKAKRVYNKAIQEALESVEIYSNYLDSSYECDNDESLEIILSYAEEKSLKEAIIKIARGDM